MKIKCIDNDGYYFLTKNKIYEVYYTDNKFVVTDNYNIISVKKYYITNDIGEIKEYPAHMFNKIDEKEIKYKLGMLFTAEDLRRNGVYDAVIEEFIKYFGFTKTVPINEESLKIMASIDGCVPFLLEKGYLKEKKEEIFYKVGDKFKIIKGSYIGDEYIIAGISENQAVLIATEGILTGYRWANQVKINDYSNITKEEFEEMCGMSGSSYFRKIGE